MTKVRIQSLTLNQIQKIIDHKLTHFDFGVPISKKAKNKNWKILTNQIFEKIIIENRRIQNVISSYVVFFQVSFFPERRNLPKFFLIRRFLRFRSFRRFFLSFFLFFSFPFHSFFESPSFQSRQNTVQSVERMEAISRNKTKFSTNINEMMNKEKKKKKKKEKKKKKKKKKKTNEKKEKKKKK